MEALPRRPQDVGIKTCTKVGPALQPDLKLAEMHAVIHPTTLLHTGACRLHAEADTIIFSTYTTLCESGYSGPGVIDVADTDVFVAAAFTSQLLPGMFCIKRKQETVVCRDLVTEEMAGCIVQLHCISGCDANSGFYSKSLVYNKVAQSWTTALEVWR